MNTKACEIWEKAWDSGVHTTDYALKRIKSAKAAKMTPIKIDETDCYGYFQGSHGRYETWLEHCPCGDFRRGKLPCKHIYRLAIELGILNTAAEHNPDAIVVPKSERVSLDKTIDIVEQSSEKAQRKLLLIASGVRSTSPAYKIALSKEIEELIDSGIIIEASSGKREIKFGRKNEIVQFLEKECIAYDKNLKKADLERVCMECAPEKAKEQFGEIISITIPSKFSPQSIHYYLHRKYDNASSYDETEKVVKYSQTPLLDTDLPNDDITEQLIKRGYYSRK